MANRPPTREEFEQHLANLSKENLYGGAQDLSPDIISVMMSPGVSRLANKLPDVVKGTLGALGIVASKKNFGKTDVNEINDKTITPDYKYLKSLKTEKAKQQAIDALKNERSY